MSVHVQKFCVLRGVYLLNLLDFSFASDDILDTASRRIKELAMSDSEEGIHFQFQHSFIFRRSEIVKSGRKVLKNVGNYFGKYRKYFYLFLSVL